MALVPEDDIFAGNNQVACPSPLVINLLTFYIIPFPSFSCFGFEFSYFLLNPTAKTRERSHPLPLARKQKN